MPKKSKPSKKPATKKKNKALKKAAPTKAKPAPAQKVPFKNKKSFWSLSLPWKGDKVTAYKYLILFELAAILVLLGYLIYLYQGFSYLPRYQSVAPNGGNVAAEGEEEADDQTYDQDFSEATLELEQDFTFFEETILRYHLENEEYPTSINDLIGDYIGADEINENFEYYVNDEQDEFEINVDLGAEADEYMANDGGNDPDVYELGTDLTIK